MDSYTFLYYPKLVVLANQYKIDKLFFSLPEVPCLIHFPYDLWDVKVVIER